MSDWWAGLALGVPLGVAYCVVICEVLDWKDRHR